MFVAILQRLVFYLMFGHFPPPFVSVVAVIRDGNKVLMINRKDGAGLGLPGGFLRLRESAEDGVKREIKEETGLDIKIKDMIHVLSGRRKGTRVCSVDLVYSAEIVGNKKLTNSLEGVCQWIDLEDINQHQIAFDYVQVLKILK